MLETPDSQISSGWVDLEGCRTHYLAAGNSRPAVLLHGGASDCRDWTPTLRYLSPYFRLYAPDIVGYGLTASPKPAYDFEDFTEFTARFVTTLCRGPAVMMGHSLGGRIALEIARRRPDLVSGLVLIGATGFGKITRVGSLLIRTFETARQVLGRRPVHPRFHFGGGNWDLVCLDALPSIGTPALLLWGEHDPYYPVHYAERACRLLPHARLQVVRGCRHGPHKERPEVAHGIIMSFLKDAARPPVEWQSRA